MLFPLLLAETVHLWAKRHINLDVKPPLEMLSGFPITIELSRERGHPGRNVEEPSKIRVCGGAEEAV